MAKTHTHARKRNAIVDTIALIAYVIWELLDEAAEAITAWLDDLTPAERKQAAIRFAVRAAFIAAVFAAGAILTGCRTPDSNPPGPTPGLDATAVHTSAVKVVQP